MPKEPKLLSDKIQEFMDWLELHTDIDSFHPSIKREVHMKLIEIMTQR